MVDEKGMVNLKEAKALINYIAYNPSHQFSQIAGEMGISISTVKRLVQKLKMGGLIIKNVGSRRIPEYSIIEWGMFNPRYFE